MDGMKLKSMDGGLTSTSSPDGINMGTTDIFWNEERIGSLMRKVDAVTVATGLVHLPALAAGQLKN